MSAALNGCAIWAYNVDLDTRARAEPRLRLTLIELGSRANHSGYVQLTVDELARRLKVTKRHMRRLVHELEQLDKLKIEPAKNRLGRQAANRFQVLSDFVRKQAATIGRGFENLAPPRSIVPYVYHDGSCNHHGAPACAECQAKHDARAARAP